MSGTNMHYERLFFLSCFLWSPGRDIYIYIYIYIYIWLRYIHMYIYPCVLSCELIDRSSFWNKHLQIHCALATLNAFLALIWLFAQIMEERLSRKEV
jgi:hypothetical protein